MSNLLTNAIKFAKDGNAPHIKISAVKATSTTFAKEITKLSRTNF